MRILDGTVDLTFSGIEYYAQQAQAFNDALTSFYDRTSAGARA